MSRIEVFADIVCPFTHVGLRRLREARERLGARPSIRVRAWPLEWVNGVGPGADLVAEEVEALRAQVAPELFAGFDPDLFPLTSIPAHGLGAAAYAVDEATGASVSFALRDALFEEGRDVSEPDVLRDIGRPFGVEPLTGEIAERAVRADWERGKARSVQGSPHFFVGDDSWFCPGLDIRREAEHFDIHVADERLRDFYAAALT